ncbi:hypothetical protein EV360DRAFT_76246 [Lentinula raphanica]|nr:hypothetical protein EV360DRAFT_76246 [Lentinula raphanica]
MLLQLCDLLGVLSLIHAKEELDRLHVEIKRLLTFMQDEERFLCNSTLLGRKVMIQCHLHKQQLHTIKSLDGFDLSNWCHFQPGTRANEEGPSMAASNEEICKWKENDDGDEKEEKSFAYHYDMAMNLTIDN